MPTYRANGKKITSPTPLTDEQLEEAFSEDTDVNTGSNTSGMSGGTSSQGGGFTGRIKEDISGVIDLAKELPGLAMNPSGNSIAMINRMIEGGSEQVRPFLPPNDTGGSLGRFLSQDPLKGAQAGLAAIPGLGRTVRSGQDLVEGKEGAAGELGYDTLMALSPKLAPKVNTALDAGLDAGGDLVNRAGAGIRSNAINRRAVLQSTPKPPINLRQAAMEYITTRGPVAMIGAALGDAGTALNALGGYEALNLAKNSRRVTRWQERLGNMLDPQGAIGELDRGMKMPDPDLPPVPVARVEELLGRENAFEPDASRQAVRRGVDEPIGDPNSRVPFEDPDYTTRSTSRQGDVEYERYEEPKGKKKKSKKTSTETERAAKQEAPSTKVPDTTPQTPFTKEYVEKHGGSTAEANSVWNKLDEETRQRLIKNPKYRARWIRTVNRKGSRASNSNPRTTEPHQGPVSVYSDPDGPGWNSYEDKLKQHPIGPSQMPDDVAEAFARSRENLDSPMTEAQMNEGLRSIMRRARRGDPDAIELLEFLEQTK